MTRPVGGKGKPERNRRQNHAADRNSTPIQPRFALARLRSSDHRTCVSYHLAVTANVDGTALGRASSAGNSYREIDASGPRPSRPSRSHVQRRQEPRQCDWGAQPNRRVPCAPTSRPRWHKSIDASRATVTDWHSRSHDERQERADTRSPPVDLAEVIRSAMTLFRHNLAF